MGNESIKVAVHGALGKMGNMFNRKKTLFFKNLP